MDNENILLFNFQMSRSTKKGITTFLYGKFQEDHSVPF